MPEITWTPEKRSVSALKELENNPRKIDKEALERLQTRIKERGFHDILKVDTDGFVLSGNQRKKALTALGIEEVYVLVPSRELTREERDKVILESNRNDGLWDYNILSEHFDIGVLKDVGFSEKELGIFDVGTIQDSGRLDEVNVESTITCPKCGHKHVWTHKRQMKKQN